MSTKTSTSTTPSRPRVLLLSLHLESWFDDMYAFHLAKLRAAADVQRAETPNAAIQQLLSSDPPPCAVLVTDAALASPAGDDDVVNPAYAPVHDALLQYVRSRGGTAVFMGHFPSFVAPPDVPGFFARAGLPWDVASYQRENFELNPAAVKGRVGAVVRGGCEVAGGYSQKALTVKG
ncbi:hypothetical protein N0V88_001596 [Collariella sp. IMI 366227]|nr:hypothetical protein N0V88_001596 [Collariella sp. IMI 366227]